MAELPPPPPGLDIHATRQPSLYAASIITWILAVLAVALRFWCRRLTKSGYKLDDWLIFAAAPAFEGIQQGFGLHLWVLSPNFITYFFKGLFTGEILYALVLCITKFSILAFHRRIFATTIKVAVYILAAVVTAWGIAIILVTIFQCTPVEGFWNRNTPANCTVSDYAFFIGNAVPNIVTDVAMILLPLPFISRLHRTTAQKIALAGIFLLGGFIIIISILRLVSLVDTDLNSPDLDWNFAFVGVWAATEGNMAIVCACLPSLRPILTMITTGAPSPSHHLKDQSEKPYRFAKKSQQSASSGWQENIYHIYQKNGQQRGFVPLYGHAGGSKSWATRADSCDAETADSGPDMELQEVESAQRGIHVRNEIRAECM
ncbi:MAG: hypothetical protein Q9181_005998 [Wetmoreana brouardii]